LRWQHVLFRYSKRTEDIANQTLQPDQGLSSKDRTAVKERTVEGPNSKHRTVTTEQQRPAQQTDRTARNLELQRTGGDKK
jgi:hypothetical protein